MNDSPTIIRRKEAQSLGLVRYYTGKPCLRGHVASRDVHKKACVTCVVEKSREYRAKNPAAAAEACKRWRQSHREHCRAVNANWRKANPAKAAQATRNWVDQNKDHRLAYARWRKALLRTFTPKWITRQDRAAMRAFKEAARKLTEESGTLHHVDHIVPIVSDVVCGLHVPWNLRVVTATENMSKHNRLIDELVLA